MSVLPCDARQRQRSRAYYRVIYASQKCLTRFLFYSSNSPRHLLYDGHYWAGHRLCDWRPTVACLRGRLEHGSRHVSVDIRYAHTYSFRPLWTICNYTKIYIWLHPTRPWRRDLFCVGFIVRSLAYYYLVAMQTGACRELCCCLLVGWCVCGCVCVYPTGLIIFVRTYLDY